MFGTVQVRNACFGMELVTVEVSRLRMDSGDKPPTNALDVANEGKEEPSIPLNAFA